MAHEDTRTKTEAVFSAHRTARGDDWTSGEQTVKNIFIAFPSYSLTVEQIDGIAHLIYAMSKEATLGVVLQRLTRNGVLRSHKERGVKIYEVNY